LASLFPEEYRELIGLIISARKKAGFTQQSLAAALNRPQSLVSKIENGERRIDPVELIHICQLMGVSALDLLHKKNASSKNAKIRKKTS
jgi:transcriptional regulator with XRE-family HTH domain